MKNKKSTAEHELLFSEILRDEFNLRTNRIVVHHIQTVSEYKDIISVEVGTENGIIFENVSVLHLYNKIIIESTKIKTYASN